MGSARSRSLVDSTNTGGGQSTHRCSSACQRRVFGNLFACTVTGAEHLCDRCVPRRVCRPRLWGACAAGRGHDKREKTGALRELFSRRTCRQRVAAGCGTVCVLTGRVFAWSEAAVGGVAGVRCVEASKAGETRAPLG